MSGDPVLPEKYKERVEVFNAFLKTDGTLNVTPTWHITDKYFLFSCFDENDEVNWQLIIPESLLNDFGLDKIKEKLNQAGGVAALNALPKGSLRVLRRQGLVLY